VTRGLHILVIIAVLFQGGAMGACQLETMLGAGPGDTCRLFEASSGISASCEDSPADSVPCACEYRKGLAQPERFTSFDLTGLNANLALGGKTAFHEAKTFASLPASDAPRTSPDVGRCLPLLI